ncbi:hypothetical protein G9A89_003605 [Geosiphon pyriformis]|nr:hypothetical protein G9A89_003605 [Geosiphon pyriformis]
MTTNYHPITNEFKVGNKTIYIHEILSNGLYKLRLDDKILAKVAYRDRLKHYYSRNNSEPLIPQIAPVVNHPQNYHPYRRKTRSHSENRLPRLLKQALEENLLIAPIDILPNATMQQKLLLLLNEQNNKHTSIYKYFHIEKTLYERKLKLKATNFTPKAIQKQIHNEFKTAVRPTNTYYKLRAAFRLYDLFNTCENVLQNLILQPIKVQYIGKLTELKFKQFSDQITSIILDHYFNITDSAWTLTELSLEEEIMLPVEF